MVGQSFDKGFSEYHPLNLCAQEIVINCSGKKNNLMGYQVRESFAEYLWLAIKRSYYFKPVVYKHKFVFRCKVDLPIY
jgi:hypothetical protein